MISITKNSIIQNFSITTLFYNIKYNYFTYFKLMSNIGDDLGAYFLRESVLRDEQITSPSLGWLLPSKLFWKDTEILVQSDQKNYTLNNLQEYFMYGSLFR